MAKKDKQTQVQRMDPDQRPLTELQAQRLGAMANVEAKLLVGLTVAQISDKFRWQIDPQLLFFRKICGRVVKTDPVTGVEYPVPFATVHVEDTDCHFLGYFPGGWQWGWFFPLWCHREVIATVTTDACGRFCVWVPRWEIDWILRWRRERICFPDLFVRPSIRDLLKELIHDHPIVRQPPIPEPDPPPFLLRDGGMSLRRAKELIGVDKAERLAAFEGAAAMGDRVVLREQMLDQPLPSRQMPPPLPKQIRDLSEKKDNEGLSSHLNVESRLFEGFNPSRYIGPFWRCFDVVVPEWTPILDVPDITFRVTQDVDGDGDEEAIYSENFFEVRWNAGPIPNVTLEASPIGVTGQVCDVPDVPCQDTPAILFAGLMPLVNPSTGDPYHDAATGYARRPNRPHPSGAIADPLPNPLASAPYAGTVHLYGCNEMSGGAFYRLRYRYEGGPWVPFTGLTWPLYRVVSGSLQTHWPTSDANGWYPILPDSANWFPENLLLAWPTHHFTHGRYTVEMQIGNASKSVIDSSTAINFEVDNSAPLAQITEVRWRVEGGSWRGPLELVCPTVTRPQISGSPANIEFRVTYQVSASHLRSLSLSGGGCGGGNPILISALGTAQHWHTFSGDNAVSNTATFALPGTMAQGAYSFSLFAASRAFNPAGGDNGHLLDWNYDPTVRYVHPSLPIAVVNG